MSPDLESKILDRFPKMFPGRKLAIDFGICVGDGWYDIVNDLCERIQKHIDTFHVDQITVVQIKEKFGTLRFYTDHGNETVRNFIDEAEKKSETTCEDCGKPGVLRNSGWLRTLCDDCCSLKKES